MKIIRANACHFYSEDKSYEYHFKINGHEAILFTETDKYIKEAIDEFIFYSGFITTIKDSHGRILAERSPNKPYLHEITKIQPSQFYISEEKLAECKAWIKSPEDILIPIVIKDGKTIAQDGHTRLKAAVDLGFDKVYVYTEDFDDYIFDFVAEAIKRGLYTVHDMEILSKNDYDIKWNKFCDEFFGS